MRIAIEIAIMILLLKGSLSLVRFFEFLAKQAMNLERYNYYRLVFLLTIVLLLYAITIEKLIINTKSLKQPKPRVFTHTSEVETTQPSLETSNASTPKTPLITNSEEIKQLLVKLKDLKNENWFLNPDIDLQSLSHATNTNATFISEVLNLELGINFNTYINNIRIKYVVDFIKKQAKNDRILSIEELYIQAGFNSKSTFNRHFKRVMSQTPTQFIDTIRI